MKIKQPSLKKSPSSQWDEVQARVREHAEKTGIPFHLWLLHAQDNHATQILSIADPIHDLHRSFREELLS